MIVKPVNTDHAGKHRPVRLPVPVGEICAPGKEGNRESAPATRAFPARKHRAGRASTPFLAQLSLQYDDGAFRRRARLDRHNRAARAYDAALASRPEPVKGGRANIRV